MTYVVIWPKAKINVDGTRTLVAAGEIVPDGVTQADLAALTSIGAIAQVEDIYEDAVDDTPVVVPDTPAVVPDGADEAVFCADCHADDVETQMVTDDECVGGHLCPIHDADHVHGGAEALTDEQINALLKGRVDDILDTVGDDVAVASAVLKVEGEKGSPRKTLVDGLEAVLTAAQDSDS